MNDLLVKGQQIVYIDQRGIVHLGQVDENQHWLGAGVRITLRVAIPNGAMRDGKVLKAVATRQPDTKDDGLIIVHLACIAAGSSVEAWPRTRALRDERFDRALVVHAGTPAGSQRKAG